MRTSGIVAKIEQIEILFINTIDNMPIGYLKIEFRRCQENTTVPPTRATVPPIIATLLLIPVSSCVETELLNNDAIISDIITKPYVFSENFVL